MSRPIPRRPPSTTEQLGLIRQELHSIVDKALDHWTDIDRQAHDMTRGYPTSTLGDDTSTTTHGSLVETNAGRHTDPGEQAKQWLAHLSEFIGHGRTLYDELLILIGPTPEEADKLVKNQTTREICIECNYPIFTRIKRLDGQPIHHPDDQVDDDPNGKCWWKAYNRTRGRRAAASERQHTSTSVQPDKPAGS